MSRPIVAILGTRYADLDIEREALAPFDAEIRRGDGEDRDAIVEVAGDADLILCGSRPRFDADTLAQLQCRAIVRYGIGVDSIDLEAARREGILVARVTDYGAEAVAMHAVTLALAGTRRLTEADRRVHSGQWGFNELRPLHLPSATTVGIVGFGRIGRAAATRFAALGFEVQAHDPYAPVEDRVPGVTAAASLEDLLASSGVVSLHLPGGEEPLLGVEEISLMREGSVLVNTARGSLIDPEALVEGMKNRRPLIAALDVHAVEPPDLAVFEPVIERLIATPHMAWYTAESELDLRHKTSQQASRILAGEPPHDVVVQPEQ